MNLLLISTLTCILEYIVPTLITYITAYLYVGKKYEADLRKSLNVLKQEISGVSMVDEFSKYAKLQRKYNKLETTLKNIETERLSNRKATRSLIIYGYRALNGLFISTLLYTYANEPVIKLPKDILWPIGNFLKWPTDHDDSISLVMWFIIAKLVISKCNQVQVVNNN